MFYPGRADRHTGLSPSVGVRPHSNELGRVNLHREMNLPNTTFPTVHEAGGFGAELFPFRSPLLRESFLVSFPPLNDMLKFGG